MHSRTWMKWLGAAGAASLVMGSTALLAPRDAAACGCFAPPDPTVPVVQAGERILFAASGGEIVAHIQIQFQGDAKEFGWLLPLPAVPKLELGNDDLFNQLITQTQPKYRMNRVFKGNCNQNLRGFGNSPAPQAAGGAEGDANAAEPKSPVVIQASIGPFDYAVLRADDSKEMFGWLEKNRYFVAVTEDLAKPYIHKGAFFLALKLRSGQSSGDLQPIVLRYASDLPMIPIVLTSVAAQKDMGIQVWMLGASRAIPRNYNHTLINDAAIDWFTSGQNYNDVIIRAVDEAPGHHSFVTEYAGPSKAVKDALVYPGRFGSTAELAAQRDPALFVTYMQQHGFAFNGQVTTILGRQIPYPAGLKTIGISEVQFYQQLSYFLGPFRQQNPKYFVGYDLSKFNPVTLAAELQMRVVEPTLAAARLFEQHAYLTRLYTTLSPDEMNKDPVFSYNRDLPEVKNLHEATLTIECGLLPNGKADSWLQTADGFTTYVGDPNATYKPPQMPGSRRIEVLREAGPPEILTDNTSTIARSLGGGGGCSVHAGQARGGSLAALFGLVVGALGLRRLRRRHG